MSGGRDSSSSADLVQSLASGCRWGIRLRGRLESSADVHVWCECRTTSLIPVDVMRGIRVHSHQVSEGVNAKKLDVHDVIVSKCVLCM